MKIIKITPVVSTGQCQVEDCRKRVKFNLLVKLYNDMQPCLGLCESHKNELLLK